MGTVELGVLEGDELTHILLEEADVEDGQGGEEEVVEGHGPVAVEGLPGGLRNGREPDEGEEDGNVLVDAHQDDLQERSKEKGRSER